MAFAMGFDGLLVTEIFKSLQGETSLAGRPFVFVRLTGCNLRCAYCDSAYAFKGGERLSVDEVAGRARALGPRDVLLTGGEPLLQRPALELARILANDGFRVSVETHGELPIDAWVAPTAPSVRLVLDVKTPDSGMCREGFRQNLPLLRARDEIKFVIASPDDYAWARAEVLKWGQAIQPREILFSPAAPAPGAPDPAFAGVSPAWLADQILRDDLDVRFQIQLHKALWPEKSRGY